MIYTGFNNAGEVEAVYAAKRATTTGTPPLSFPSKGYDLEDFLISGNTIQNGTPTPSDPVDVVGCGARTGNLFDGNYINAYIDVAQYKFVNVGTDAISAVIEVEPNTTYTVKKYDTSNRFLIGKATGVPTLHMVLPMISTDNEKTEVTFITESSTKYIVVYVSTGAEHATPRLMFNKGGIALPYEPYGYKLPPTINNIEHQIYLGNVQTTRRIKKLVLTGKEDWTKTDDSESGYFRSIIGAYNSVVTRMSISTHFLNASITSLTTDIGFNVSNSLTLNASTVVIRPDNIISMSVSDFCSYLAAQYANGTPVTVWYVLTEPETGIVNEPLHKIGNYADTISLSQSGITVSTTAGINNITTETTVLPSSISVTTPEKEVEEIYAGINYQNPVYYKTRTLTGTLPLSYKALSKPPSDYLISGNIIQNGTPSPEAPVDVVGCGARTGNLLNQDADGWERNYCIENGGRIKNNVHFDTSPYIEILPEKVYTLVDRNNGSEACNAFYDADKNFISSFIAYGQKLYTATSPSNAKYIRCSILALDRYPKAARNAMLIEGDTEPPAFIPYGYKLPLTVNGQEIPIYLGQV